MSIDTLKDMQIVCNVRIVEAKCSESFTQFHISLLCCWFYFRFSLAWSVNFVISGLCLYFCAVCVYCVLFAYNTGQLTTKWSIEDVKYDLVC